MKCRKSCCSNMNDKFIVLGKEKSFLAYLDKYVFSSYPKNETSLKIKLNDEIYKLIENTMRVNLNKGNIRSKYIKEVKLNIMMIDFLLDVTFEKEIIIKKRFLSCLRMLTEIKNIIYSLDYTDEIN